MNNSLFDLIMRKSKSQHKTFWLRKVLTVNFRSSMKISTAHSAEIESSRNKNVFMINDITAHNSFQKAIEKFNQLIKDYFKLWTNQEFVNLFEKNWMKISLKFDWESTIKNKVKIYSFDIRDKAVVNDTFNKFHEQERFFWTEKTTSFNYSCFVIWRKSSEKQKKRVVIDIRNLNFIFQSDVYSLSLQNDIIQIVQECSFISIINCFSFFYQWRVHSSNRHKFIVISHREQKIFNVAVMSYKNFSMYVQRQIDRVLRFFDFARVYVDDIIIFSNSFQSHLKHLRQIFEILSINNISVNSKKIFLKYSSMSFLRQHVISLKLFTNKEKFQIIVNFIFLKTLNKLKTYLKLTK